MELLTLNWLVGIGTFLLQLVVVGLTALYILRNQAVQTVVAKYAIWGAFLTTLGATFMSLVYSDHYGIVPCGLCWLSRIMMFPQVILFGIALYRKERAIAFYSLVLSVIGLAISLYHHYIQMGGGHALPCPASGASDCAKRYIFEMGYITFPLVGATVFAFVIILMLFVLRSERETKMGATKV